MSENYCGYTGAEVIVRSLIDHQVKVVFGYPGGQALDLYDALYQHTDEIHHILTAHEQGAAHAADGYARATGKVGVVIATSGPGATNLVTGIANAYLDSTPMVAITGNVSTPDLGRDSFQEVDIVGITMPITKHNFIVRDVSELPAIIDEAFWLASTGRPGPVLIDVPKDIQQAVCEHPLPAQAHRKPYATPGPGALRAAVELIANAQRPYIYCGGGVVISDASKEVMELADKIDAPIGESMMGLSAIPSSYPGHLGMAGMHGLYASTKAKAESDLIIAIGVRFSNRATGDKQEYVRGTRFIHIEIDPAEINKNIPVDAALCGDVRATLRLLIPLLEEKRHPDWREKIQNFRPPVLPTPAGSMTPGEVIGRVQSHCGEDMLVATDVGQHQMWVAQYWKFERPRTFITSGGLGTMGFGLGAAIGACMGSGGRKTVLFTGDGSFGMNLNEMATAVSQGLPLVIILMNNGVLGMVRQWQGVFYDGRYSQTTLERKTDFVKLAEAFGARGVRAGDLAALDNALEAAFAADGPFLIDCAIHPDEKVLPMIPPGGSIKNIMLS